MHLSSRLDADLVAVESPDSLTLLVEVAAPAPVGATARPSATLQVVLDRSGSMGGERLAGAQAALLGLIDRLDPTDNLGVVAFDDTVHVVVPCGPLTDKPAARKAVASVDAGGSTDLSAGYLRGLQEVDRVAAPGGATVLLVSDGHANRGVQDPDRLGAVAAQAASRQTTTSTLGFGLGYDERLLAALARGGQGNELFAEEADAAGALIAGEVDGLLSQVAQAASLRVRLGAHVEAVRLLNDLPTNALDDGLLVELGSFYAGETRRLVLELSIPGIASLGLAQVAVLELTHVGLPDLVQHTATLPVTVNVVPGDQAAGRVADPEVRSEALFQQTQAAKKRSSRLLSEGRVSEAGALLRDTAAGLTSALGALPPACAAELGGEARVLESLADEASYDSARAAKASSYDASAKSRTRGRRSRGGTVVLRCAEPGGPSDLVLEEWQLQRLRRGLDVALADALLPSPGVRSSEVAGALLQVFGDVPELGAFFLGAAVRGGFTVQRA